MAARRLIDPVRRARVRVKTRRRKYRPCTNAGPNGRRPVAAFVLRPRPRGRAQFFDTHIHVYLYEFSMQERQPNQIFPGVTFFTYAHKFKVLSKQNYYY